MKQILLGIIALGLLLAWAVLYIGGGDDSTFMAASVCLRAGLVLGALSLALPQVLVVLARVPLWMMGCMGIGLLAIVRWPKSAVYVIPGMAALWFLRPRAAGRATEATRRAAVRSKTPRGKTSQGKTSQGRATRSTSRQAKARQDTAARVAGKQSVKVGERGVKASDRAAGEAEPNKGRP